MGYPTSSTAAGLCGTLNAAAKWPPNVQQANHLGNANRCFNCGSLNHFAKQCPQAGQSNQGQGFHWNNQNKGKKQTVKVRQERINFTTLAELPEGVPVMTGTFSIHHKPAVILFDSGASHSFISANLGLKLI